MTSTEPVCNSACMFSVLYPVLFVIMDTVSPYTGGAHVGEFTLVNAQAAHWGFTSLLAELRDFQQMKGNINI